MKPHPLDLRECKFYNQLPLDCLIKADEMLDSIRSQLSRTSISVMLFGSVEVIKVHLKNKRQRMLRELAENETALDLQIHLAKDRLSGMEYTLFAGDCRRKAEAFVMKVVTRSML